MGVHQTHLNEIIGDEKIYSGHFCKPEEVGKPEITSKGLIILWTAVVAGDNSDLKLRIKFYNIKS